MVVYYSVLCFICPLLYCYDRVKAGNKPRHKWLRRLLLILFAVLPFVVLFLLSALREGIGTDFEAYRIFFNSIKNDAYFGEKMEVAYRFLNRIIADAGLGFREVIFVTSLMAVGFCYAGIIKSSPMVWISVLIYFCGYHYFASFNIIRQCIAMSLVFFGAQFLRKKMPFIFIVALVAAVLFHTSALIAVVLLPIYYIKSPLWTRLVAGALIIGAFLLFWQQIYVGISFFYGNYLAGFEPSWLYVSFRKIEIEAIILVAACVFLDKSRAHNRFLIDMQICTLVMCVLPVYLPYSDRTIMYFSIFQILLIPGIIASFKNPYAKGVATAVVVVSALLYLYYYIDLRGWGEVLPYRWIFGA